MILFVNFAFINFKTINRHVIIFINGGIRRPGF